MESNGQTKKLQLVNTFSEKRDISKERNLQGLKAEAITQMLQEEDENDDEDYSREHIVVAGDPVTQQPAFDDYDDENRLKIVDESEVHGVSPLHKRCVHCNMVMLKKNLSRHIRDQHTEERPR